MDDIKCQWHLDTIHEAWLITIQKKKPNILAEYIQKDQFFGINSQIFPKIPKYSQIFPNFLKYSQIFPNIPKYYQIFPKSIPK